MISFSESTGINPTFSYSTTSTLSSFNPKSFADSAASISPRRSTSYQPFDMNRTHSTVSNSSTASKSPKQGSGGFDNQDKYNVFSKSWEKMTESDHMYY